jgi:hypothetical protein
MDKLLNNLKEIFKKVTIFIYKLYNKLLFLFNKQRTIQNIYGPIIKEKQSAVDDLLKNLNKLKFKNKETHNNIQVLIVQNNSVKSKITSIQNIIAKRDL